MKYINYKMKYIKYKTKYIKLKSLMYGGNEHQEEIISLTEINERFNSAKEDIYRIQNLLKTGEFDSHEIETSLNDAVISYYNNVELITKNFHTTSYLNYDLNAYTRDIVNINDLLSVN